MPKAYGRDANRGLSRVVVGFAGPIGAGKTTGARYLACKYSFGYVRYSEVLAEWMYADRGAKATLQDYGWKIMSRGLQGELNRRVIQAIHRNRSYAVDGLRHRIDEQSLSLEFGTSFFLLYVDATEALRWERTSRAGQFKDLNSFRAADTHPVERPLRAMRGRSSAVIQNSGSIAEYYTALDETIRQICNTSAGDNL